MDWCGPSDWWGSRVFPVENGKAATFRSFQTVIGECISDKCQVPADLLQVNVV